MIAELYDEMRVNYTPYVEDGLERGHLEVSYVEGRSEKKGHTDWTQVL